MVLMVDTSASMDEKLSAARTAGKRFVRTLRPQDDAQVMQFNDRATVLQDFTADHAALEDAFDRTEASGPTALHNALYVALKDLAKQKTRARAAPPRLVLLSDGEDTASLVSDDQVLELARKTEINIYAISLRAKAAPDRNRLKFSQAAHLLTALTQDTGGQVHFPNSLSELDAVYDRIAEELRTQYSLGYVSSNKRARRQVAPHRGARARRARTCRSATSSGTTGCRRPRGSARSLRPTSAPGRSRRRAGAQQGEHRALLAPQADASRRPPSDARHPRVPASRRGRPRPPRGARRTCGRWRRCCRAAPPPPPPRATTFLFACVWVRGAAALLERDRGQDRRRPGAEVLGGEVAPGDLPQVAR